MIKIKKTGNTVQLMPGRGYELKENMVLVSKKNVLDAFSTVDLTSNNLNAMKTLKSITDFFDNDVYSCDYCRIDNEKYFIVSDTLVVNNANYKKLFININGLYNAVREYIHMDKFFYSNHTDDLYDQILAFKSVNTIVTVYDNFDRDKKSQVIDYKMTQVNSTLDIAVSTETSRVTLVPILINQIDNVLCKTLNFKKEEKGSELYYTNTFLSVKDAKDVYTIVTRHLHSLDIKFELYGKVWEEVEKGIDLIVLDVDEKVKMNHFFLNIILFRKDFITLNKINAYTITDMLRLVSDNREKIQVNKDVVDKIISTFSKETQNDLASTFKKS